jgi:hypothetical protein
VLLPYEKETNMPKFVTIGYGDQAGYDRTPEAARQAAHAHDAALVRRGVVMGIAGKPVKVRNPKGAGVQVQPGAYLSSGLPVAGFAIMEARDLDEAIEMAAKSPCAIAHGVIEVWPLEQPLPGG